MVAVQDKTNETICCLDIIIYVKVHHLIFRRNFMMKIAFPLDTITLFPISIYTVVEILEEARDQCPCTWYLYFDAFLC